MELLKELVRLCDALNSARIKYAVVGGCAVILHGYYRTTHDIDLVVDSFPKNVEKLKEVLYRVYHSKEVFESNYSGTKAEGTELFFRAHFLD